MTMRALEGFSLYHMSSSTRETASYILGVISVIVWVIAEIPQIITNYTAKSAKGLSLTFLLTWVIGDIFNLLGCILEPATLPTQLYMAVPETPEIFRRSDSAEQKASDAEHSDEYDDFSDGAKMSSPIPFPGQPQSPNSELFYQSARYLSKSFTPTAGSVLAQRASPTSSYVGSIHEGLLGSAAIRQSAPAIKIKSTFCLVSTLTFLGAIKFLQSLDRRIDPLISSPRQEVVIYVGRKLFQVGGEQMLEEGLAGSLGTLLGWAMTLIYLGGRLPQICLNIRRGHAEGLNPLMFLFALMGNVTYVGSILVISLEWSRIKPNLPWLVDAGGCVLLDGFILMQFMYFRFWSSPQSDYKPLTVA
nr:probable vacuolar amino acid transporter YPQ1 isoform X2 [Arachis hypogaea]